MADNTTLNPGASGDVIRTLDRTGTGAPKTEVVQIDLGGGDSFGEQLVQARVPVALLDAEWPVDDDGVPLVNLSSGSAADPPTASLQQQILAVLQTNAVPILPPAQQAKIKATGAPNAAVFKTNGAQSALIFCFAGFSALQIATNASIDGATFVALPWVLVNTGSIGASGLITGGTSVATIANSNFAICVNCAGFNYVNVVATALATGSVNVLFQPLNTPSPFPVTASVISDPSNGVSANVQNVSGTGCLGTNVSAVLGSQVVAAATGVQKVGVSGNAGASFDSATGAVPPANALQIGLLAASTNPANATAGRQTPPFADLAGRLVVTPVNPRALIKTTATTISATGATNIVAAQGANVFADITMLVITTAGAAAQTITISDGTLSWIVDYPNAAVAPGQPLVVDFGDVPLPATTANTAWTANQSVATACHYLVVNANRLA